MIGIQSSKKKVIFGSTGHFLLNSNIFKLLMKIINKLKCTIKRHQNKDLKEDFYKFMSLNSKFNCLYCVIFAFFPINSCLDPRADLFCSSIQATLFAQYYKIVCVALLGESVKMCANISYLLITVNRYMLIGREHSVVLEWISKIEFKSIVLFSLCFSFILNIGHILGLGSFVNEITFFVNIF
jgi:hypothetical protein